MNDFRFALRQLARHRLFTLVAAGTLALGIGATTTIFSVVDHLMLRDLPFPDADRIVTVWQDMTKHNEPKGDVAPANYLDWKARNQTLLTMGATEPYSVDLTGTGRPEVLETSLVTDGFLAALGARAHLGRLFHERDYTENAGTVAVLGYGLWQRRFGGDPAVVGTAIRLDGAPVTVVGVMQRDFDLGLRYSERPPDVWMPRQWDTWEQNSRTSAWWMVVGRLKPGVSLEQARADMDRVAAGLAEEYPSTNEGVGTSVIPLREHLVGAAQPALFALLAAVGLVLLVACVNVANLLLARGAEREREFVVRAALGAARGRLVRQMIAESAAIALVAAVIGIGLTFWAVDVVKGLAPADIPRFDTVAVNLRVLGFAVGLAVVTALAFGLAPALRLSRPDVREALAEGRVTAGRRRLRLRDGLIVAETAFALALLVGSALMIRSFATLLQEDPGFRRDHLAALQVFYYGLEDDYTPQQTIQFFQETLEEMRALPGVRAAGAVSAAPFLAANLDIRRVFHRADRPAPRPGEEPQTYLAVATPGYFTTLGIPVLRGRGIEPSDDASGAPVAVVNQTFSRRFYPDENPVGRQIRLGTSPTPIEIVGVVGDTRHTGLDVAPRPEVFLPHALSGTGSMTYFVRTDAEPTSLLPALQDVVWDREPLQTFHQVGVVEDMIGATLTSRRFTLVLLTVFAAIGLSLAAVGVYGVMSFTVSRRTHEVGIRMALGADRGAVVGMIVGRGVRLALMGVVVGTALALLTAPLLQDLLYRVPPRDVVALGASALVLVGAAFLASWLPARRATRIDPMEALRHE